MSELICRFRLPGYLIPVLLLPVVTVAAAHAARPDDLCRISVVDSENGWPVPLVELQTTNDVRFVTDNAGVIAFDDPSLMDREVWFQIMGHGYGVPKDGFGYSGVRLSIHRGAKLTVKVQRSCVAKRIGRLTGAGLFVESQKLGEERRWKDGPVLGCDTVQNAVHRGKLFWAWGDTDLARYPLGVFDASSATTAIRPFRTFEPPLKPTFEYFTDDDGRPRGVAAMPGDGPTWLFGYVSLPDADGTDRLVATYYKVKPPLDVYKVGTCIWNDQQEKFEHLLTVWTKESGQPRPSLDGSGHPAFWTDDSGKRWVLMGNPLPHVRFPATFEAWQDQSAWDQLTPQKTLVAADGGKAVVPHSGSIAYNPWRKKWVSVFLQKHGHPSFLGTLWYAEADAPTGPWGPAVEILRHDNYTFYNPRIHMEMTPEDEPVLLFEGTYTTLFTQNSHPTPRYDYNQILYRLDLDDPKLAPARGE